MLSILILLISVTSTSCEDLPPLTYACRTAQKPECNKVHFVPGHNLLGEGFDIVTMKQKRAHLLGLHKFASGKGGCTVCNNPYMKKTWQKLPLAMEDWKPQSFCSRRISSQVSQSSTSLAEEAASNVKNEWDTGLEVHHEMGNAKLVLAGSQSQLEQFAQTKTSSDRYTFIKHQLSCVYYSFRLSRKARLSQDVHQAFKALPPTYNSKTQQEYRHFISIFGTHYISQADVGGRAEEVTAIRTCRASMDGLSVDELKDCLSLEASLAVTGKAEANAKFSTCKELSQKANKGESFHQKFSERSWQVSGGKITFSQLSFDSSNGGNAESFETWMETLKTDPEIVSYSLEPVHNLVRWEGPQRENLRRAVSEYIMEKALRRNCSCSSGAAASHGGECLCLCPGSDSRDVNCCPSRRGLAKVAVTVLRAQDLWGDHGSRTDAYVRVSYGVKAVQTMTIWNTDHPVWDLRFDLSILDLSLGSDLKVEVWDEDNKYDDDLLGKCERSLNSGEKEELCYFQHGSVTFRVSVTCLPHLAGPLCKDYAPSTN